MRAREILLLLPPLPILLALALSSSLRMRGGRSRQLDVVSLHVSLNVVYETVTTARAGMAVCGGGSGDGDCATVRRINAAGSSSLLSASRCRLPLSSLTRSVSVCGSHSKGIATRTPAPLLSCSCPPPPLTSTHRSPTRLTHFPERTSHRLRLESTDAVMTSCHRLPSSWFLVHVQ